MLRDLWTRDGFRVPGAALSRGRKRAEFPPGRRHVAAPSSSSVDRVTADGRSNVGAASDVWRDDAIFSNGGCEEKLSHKSQMGFVGGVAAVPGFPSLIPDVGLAWSVRTSSRDLAELLREIAHRFRWLVGPHNPGA